MFDTSAFRDLIADTAHVTSWKSCTFAWCRFGSDAQKYTTFWYTEDAAAGFDILNSPTYQCNYADGEHKRHAGGTLADGRWASEEFTAFPDELNAFIASASTISRTGRSTPVSHPKRQVSILGYVREHPPTQPDTQNDHDDVTQSRHRKPTPSPHKSSRISPPPVLFGGFSDANTPSPKGPRSRSSYIPFAPDGSPAYVPFDISKARVLQGVSDRHVRSSTRSTVLAYLQAMRLS